VISGVLFLYESKIRVARVWIDDIFSVRYVSLIDPFTKDGTENCNGRNTEAMSDAFRTTHTQLAKRIG
jgi:hypothetical protein